MKIIGHEKQICLLKEAVKNNTMPHAMIFNGDEAIGKKLVALDYAKTFYCERNSSDNNYMHYAGCGNCKSCRLFDTFDVPDFYFIECEDKEQIKTENIRNLLYKLNLKNFSSKNKFIIFNNAHLIKEQSANILLKTLEEPKDNTYFILVTSNYSMLPITIISRCHLWYFENLKDDEILEILKQKNISLNSNDDLKLLEGSMLNVEAIINQDNDYKSSFENQINLILDGDMQALATLTKDICANKDSLKYNLLLLRTIIRTKMINEQNSLLKSKLAITLENLIFSEYLIFDRYLGSQNVMYNIFLNLLPSVSQNDTFMLNSIY